MPVSTVNYDEFGDGVTTYVFGVDDANATIIPGMQTETITITASPEFEAFAKNTAGATAAYVRGKDKFEFTASGFMISEVDFDASTNLTFTYQGHFFIINKKEKADSNVDFRKCNVSGVAFNLITTAS